MEEVLEKLTVPQQVTLFFLLLLLPSFYGTQRFIIVLTRL
jgi:hypothetical protein